MSLASCCLTYERGSRASKTVKIKSFLEERNYNKAIAVKTVFSPGRDICVEEKLQPFSPKKLTYTHAHVLH